jgi:hypothetical protein
MGMIGLLPFAVSIGWAMPAGASLEASEDYNAAASPEIELTEYTGSVACDPQPQYLPYFVRTADGSIVGVKFITVRSDQGC